jgi:hypothetical protein
MYLEKETFKTVIASTPLISIDLVVKNSRNARNVVRSLFLYFKYFKLGFLSLAEKSDNPRNHTDL